MPRSKVKGQRNNTLKRFPNEGLQKVIEYKIGISGVKDQRLKVRSQTNNTSKIFSNEGLQRLLSTRKAFLGSKVKG